MEEPGSLSPMWVAARGSHEALFYKLYMHSPSKTNFIQRKKKVAVGVLHYKSSLTHTCRVLQLLVLVSLRIFWLWVDAGHTLTLNCHWDLSSWLGDIRYDLCHASQLGRLRTVVVGALKALLRRRLGRHVCAVLVWLRRDIRRRLGHWLRLRHLSAWLLTWLLRWQ